MRSFRSGPRALAVSAALAVAIGVVAAPAASAATLTPTTGDPAGAGQLASAIAADATIVTGAAFEAIPGTGTPHAVGDALDEMPTSGTSFAILTTGNAQVADDPNSAGNTGTDLGGTPVRGDTDRDVTVLRIDLDLPAAAGGNCLELDFAFYSEEYPEWVGTQYNDAFIAELDTSSWTTSGSTISAPDNFAFDSLGNPVTVNTTGSVGMTAADSSGTTYDAGTPLLSAATPAAPGPHSLYLSIFDQGDNVLDSAVFVDNLRWYHVDDPSVDCAPGATPTDPNEPPTAEAGGPYSVDEGSAVQLDGSASSDPDGDTLSYQWAPAANLDDATSAAPQYTGVDDTVDVLTLTVTDPSGESDSDDATVTVHNVAPTITEVIVPEAPVAVGSSVAVSAPYTDPGSADSHTWTFDWNDGTSDDLASSGTGDGTAQASHTYTTPGVYTVTVTVTDDDGGSDTLVASSYVVIYDPSAGFVTGGGWIDSPAGAYPAQPELTGKASFGFVSKYKKGQSTPDGNTEFQFRTADLNFHSSSYDWLVIAGNKAKYKGHGTINGTSGYSFLISAVDGGADPDTFRIKIWETATETVVYDNQMGAEDGATAVQPIAGGSITVHAK